MDIKFNPHAQGRHRIINNMRLMGSLRKSAKLYRLACAGFLDVPMHEAIAYVTQVDQMITILKIHHPERWDIIYNEEYRRLAFVIHYPKAIIKNRNDVSHEIRDYFMVQGLTWSDEKRQIVLGPLKGTRATLTYAEFSTGYFHSHLHVQKLEPSNSEAIMRASSYCTGDGEINDMIVAINTEFTPIKFDMYVQLLTTLVEWESISGNPYIRFSTVADRAPATTYINTRVIPEAVKKIYYRLKREDIEKLTFNYTRDRYGVSPNRVFHEVVKKIIIQDLKPYWGTLLVTKTRIYPGGPMDFKGYQIRVNPNNPTQNFKVGGQTPYTYIHGQKIEFKILPTRVNQEGESAESPQNYEVHPDCIKQLQKRIEQTLYKKGVESAAVRAYLASPDQLRDIPQNEISVS